MKVVTPEISWHEREPIYSVDLQSQPGNIQRLASCGVDKTVRIWRLRVDSEGKVDLDFLSNLNRHTATVNVCRFSPDGKLLATAGDDAVILLWKLSDVPTPANNIFSDEDSENKETYVVHKSLRGHLGDVYDLCWSQDGRYLVSGSVDNSAIAWDIQKDVKLALFNEHKSYVQGVAWDPLKEYIATLSSDRSCRIFNLATKHCIHNVSKVVPRHAAASAPEGTKVKAVRMFHDDTLRSFFRRLAFSPDGQLLIAPAGLMETGEKQTNATFVFTRGSFKEPACYLPSPQKASVAVRVCPSLFELRPVKRKDSDEDSVADPDKVKEWEKYSTVFCLPYRVVFAVATEDSVVIYDSQQTLPIAHLSNIHYHTLSDLAWSKDGRILVVSSTDGYCSVVTFDEGELGIIYTPKPTTTAAADGEKTAQSPQSAGDSKTAAKMQPPPSSALPTNADDKMEVDQDPPAKPTSSPQPKTAASPSTAPSTTPSKPSTPATKTSPATKPSTPPTKPSTPQTKPSTSPTKPSTPDIKVISGMEGVKISESGSPGSCNKSEGGGSLEGEKETEKAKKDEEKKKDESTAGKPKRIQLTTLSLLKPK